ncbi:putative phage-related terminase [Anaplasma centrale str. Israel]|uniref:Putative phage-related terminase n=1 Tax=Anaplasma centrale (strain Israel) TaxID=574556 RepID=D1AUR8_ANACI|nr:phage terminase large subunit [Anaplasma centrale]ACZ49296.1 putative phage-related terminase [Anaplasma centrale str. Israel]
MKFIKFLKLVFETVATDSRYVDNWHIRAIADRLEAALAGKIKRLIINVPPRSMKSICVSVAWPAWILGLNPRARIIAASYSQILSTRLSMDTRYVLQAAWYQKLFPDVEIAKDQNTKHRFQTTQLGYRFATSVGGTLTGEGGNFLIVDDPMNPLQSASKVYRQKVCDWFNQSLLTRLNNRKNGIVVVVMHRLHIEDLTGHLLAKRGYGNVWHHLSLPLVSPRKTTVYAFALPHILQDSGQKSKKVLYVRQYNEPLYKNMSAQYIKRLKRDVGTYAFSAQYQQCPIDNLGKGIIKRQWFKRYYDTAPQRQECVIVHSWDTASAGTRNSNFSVCTVWACKHRDFFLLEVHKVQLKYTALKRLVLHLANLWKADTVLIESKSSGVQLIQELSHHISIVPVTPIGAKDVRVYKIIPMIESGHVLLPHEASWLGDFEQEICSFPYSRHNDQVDSMVQFLLWIRETILAEEHPQIRVM